MDSRTGSPEGHRRDIPPPVLPGAAMPHESAGHQPVDRRHTLVEQLIDEIERRLPAEQALPLAEFAQQFYARFPVEELSGRALADLYASACGGWQFVQVYDASRPKIHIFNPDLDEHGWQLPHTVIALLCRDMPFALDSVRGELNSRNIAILTIHAAPLRVQRDARHRLVRLLAPADDGAAASTETFIYLEINRHSNPDDMAQLRAAIADVLREVERVVDDFAPMRQRAAEVRNLLVAERAQGGGNGHAAALDETARFIDWLLDDNFTFLGYEYLQVRHGEDHVTIERAADGALGLLREALNGSDADLRAELADGTAGNALSQQLRFAKSSHRTRVHRRVYPDYVDVRLFDADGRIEAEHRFLGLYTSRVYTISPAQIPVVGRKVEAVLARAEFGAGSHERSELARVLDVYPRDELFHAGIEELYATALAIRQIQERRVVRLFVRRDPRGRYVSCLVYMPRDIYNTELRCRVQNLLVDVFAAREAEFATFFSESILTRTHFMLQLDPGHPVESPLADDTAALQAQIVQICMSWQDHLRNYLIEEFGEEQGVAIAREYDGAFPPGYRDEYDPRAAVADIRKMAELRSEHDIAMRFYRVVGGEQPLRFRLYRLDRALPLSDVMPILENLGLRVLGEHSYAVRRRGTQLWIHEFILSYAWGDGVDIFDARDNFQEAFARIWHGDAENDGFNRLVLSSGLGWRAVAMLRAYARYLKQIQFSFAGEYIADALVKHRAIAQLLVQLFQVRFDPALALDDAARSERQDRLEARITAALDGVDNLSEDRIIRQYVALLKATVRTNYFQTDASGAAKNYFAFKLDSASVPDMPQPRPLFEIFVHSPRVEGVHLRTSRVARGGLRWSDRPEDFRTEVLGLVKAQNVKNAVIVPTGAKGGFVVRRSPAGDRETLQQEGIACYRIFVSALLDLTDNLAPDGPVPAPQVVRHDGDDIYLVVAADKGTASFSDIANEIAQQRGFWLGDAFASGGSVGYDHKRMGITARGAWISVRRHFREMGINIQDSDFTVIGIGDMSGDVFGNGMLMSRHIRLLAAFNHQHIFIDPAADAERSYVERERLFNLPRSSWEDYDAGLISAGGGVFRRSAKTIAITPQMRERFAIDAEQLTPNELIAALLKAPVDLLWNGGIGTYVKGSGQTHAECGDKANDAVRVNGADLRCKVIGEGGNLGCTQPGRIEYALRGGRCNTDFIDNAAGVDCSDHEVNIKIALNALLAAGDMTEKQRRELLRAMTDAVGELVLRHNYRQTQALSLAERQALARSGEYERLIRHMVTSGWLQRELEHIPGDEALLERKAGGSGLTRPELAVLISYTKGQLKAALAVPAIADDPLVSKALFDAFPQQLCAAHRAVLEQHRLRAPIIGTRVANDMVDLMGITFVERMTQSTGATVIDVARAFVTAREVFDMHTYWSAIEALDDRVDAALQLDMMAIVTRLVRRATRWFIRNRRVHLEPKREVERFRAPIADLYREYPQILAGRVLEDFTARRQALLEGRVPEVLANYVATAHYLYPVLSIIDAATEVGTSVRKMAEVYMALSQALELDAFARQIAELKVENHWQAQARETFRDDLEWQQRRLAVGAFSHLCPQGDVQACIQRWLKQQQPLVERWRSLLMELHGADSREFAVFAVAIRELLDLAQSTQHGSLPSA